MRWGLKGAAKRGLNPRDSLEGTRYMQLFAQSVHDRLGFSKRRGFDRERWARMNREHDAEYWARKARAHLFKSRKR